MTRGGFSGGRRLIANLIHREAQNQHVGQFVSEPALDPIAQEPQLESAGKLCASEHAQLQGQCLIVHTSQKSLNGLALFARRAATLGTGTRYRGNKIVCQRVANLGNDPRIEPMKPHGERKYWMSWR